MVYWTHLEEHCRTFEIEITKKGGQALISKDQCEMWELQQEYHQHREGSRQVPRLTSESPGSGSWEPD